MKLIIFNKNNKVLDIFEGKTFEIDGEVINFDSSTVTGINEEFVIVDDDVSIERGDKITDEIKGKDKKEKLHKKKPTEELQTELGALQAESAAQLQAIADIYEMLTIQGIDPSVLSGGDK